MFTNFISEKYVSRLQISRRRSFVSRKHEKKKIKNKEIKFVFVELRGEKNFKGIKPVYEKKTRLGERQKVGEGMHR
jgi:hypothetical protein